MVGAFGEGFFFFLQAWGSGGKALDNFTVEGLGSRSLEV